MDFDEIYTEVAQMSRKSCTNCLLVLSLSMTTLTSFSWTTLFSTFQPGANDSSSYISLSDSYPNGTTAGWQRQPIDTGGTNATTYHRRGGVHLWGRVGWTDLTQLISWSPWICIVGTLAMSVAQDLCGRKACLLASSGLVLIGDFLLCITSSKLPVIVALTLLSFNSLFSHLSSAIIIYENVGPDLRSLLLSILFVVFLLNKWLWGTVFYFGGHSLWPVLLLFSVSVVVLLMCHQYAQDSARWLLTQRLYTDGKLTLYSWCSNFTETSLVNDLISDCRANQLQTFPSRKRNSKEIGKLSKCWNSSLVLGPKWSVLTIAAACIFCNNASTLQAFVLHVQSPANYAVLAATLASPVFSFVLVGSFGLICPLSLTAFVGSVSNILILLLNLYELEYLVPFFVFSSVLCFGINIILLVQTLLEYLPTTIRTAGSSLCVGVIILLNIAFSKIIAARSDHELALRILLHSFQSFLALVLLGLPDTRGPRTFGIYYLPDFLDSVRHRPGFGRNSYLVNRKRIMIEFFLPIGIR